LREVRHRRGLSARPGPERKAVNPGIEKMSKRFAAPFARMRKLLSAFRSNKRGNVAVICAVSAIPLVTAAGCVVDYSMASMIRTKIQAAADAATLATVSINSPEITTAKGMTGGGTISGGATDLTNYFNANLTTTTGYTGLSPTPTVTKSGMVITANLTYTAQVPTFFLGIIGRSTLSISGSSTASYTLPTFIDFYLMLDVSGSMGMPSTTAEQNRLQSVNPDNYALYPSGCTFACHFTAQGGCAQSNQRSNVPPSAWQPTYNPSPGGYCQGFTISRLGTTPATGTITPTNINWSNTKVSSCPDPGTTSCIQLRLDAVGYAVNALLNQASTTETNDGVSNQFRVGLYPFIQNLYATYSPLTTSLTGSSITTAATQLANLLDTGQNATLGSGGTHFENALNSMNSTITSVGTGTSTSNTLPYVFLVTDGSQDYQTQWGGGWSSQNWSPTSAVPYQNSSTVLPPNSVTSSDYCTTMKNRGITIAILYIPYQTIQNANAGFASNEDGYANNNIPNIPAALQSCASPNFFYTANTPADITSALITMFEQAVSTARITN
jgi:Flp pilus assembly protein TadG